jgi:hypothetical protein
MTLQRSAAGLITSAITSQRRGAALDTLSTEVAEAIDALIFRSREADVNSARYALILTSTAQYSRFSPRRYYHVGHAHATTGHQ